jgi:hypothetical protein
LPKLDWEIVRSAAVPTQDFETSGKKAHADCACGFGESLFAARKDVDERPLADGKPEEIACEPRQPRSTEWKIQAADSHMR